MGWPNDDPMTSTRDFIFGEQQIETESHAAKKKLSGKALIEQVNTLNTRMIRLVLSGRTRTAGVANRITLSDCHNRCAGTAAP